jgi:hypothetical protein
MDQGIGKMLVDLIAIILATNGSNEKLDIIPHTENLSFKETARTVRRAAASSFHGLKRIDRTDSIIPNIGKTGFCWNIY